MSRCLNFNARAFSDIIAVSAELPFFLFVLEIGVLGT